MELLRAIRELSPNLDKAIQTWGDDGKEPWSLEDGVNNLVEKIEHQTCAICC
ncbi:MAG: hypothetical protein F6K40_17505 [Okeania sp. SIO3I5]|uniref:hypothetical protein n=1 Tax=Okeania sp. SIO3I5 TaxID=2607805 RepID=UPI0013BCF63D|nr:hypothetical protein [Okeania sp. SIO3I5]NEQ37962.1 hypothetical protein [Okeania sp. SIO3I5]